MKLGRVISVLLISVLSMLLVVAPSLNVFSGQAGEPPYGTTPEYGGTLVVGMTDDPASLCPALLYTTPCWFAGGPCFEGLVRLDYNLTVEPCLAKSWEVSPSADTYTFHLYENVTWHDGVPFTSADVKFSLETTKKYHAQGVVLLEYLYLIETPDNYTVILHFSKGNAALLRFMVEEHVGCIIPKHLYENTDVLNNPYNLHPIGTGPFKFKEWVRGDHITYVKYENYYRTGKPYLDSIVFKIIPSAEALLAAFQTGEVDAIPKEYVPTSEFETIKSLPNVAWNYHGGEEGGSIVCTWCNLRNPILSQIGVRQAIAHAFDRQAMIETAAGGMGVPAEQFLVHTVQWCWNPDVPKYEYNVTLAEKMLDDLGYPSGPDGTRFKLTLTYIPTFDYWVKSCEVVKDQLAKVGIVVQLVPLEYSTFCEKVFINFDFDLCLTNVLTGPDFESIKVQFTADGIGAGYWSNCMGYNNTKVNELFDLQESEGDQTIRAVYIRKINAIMMEEVPNIVLYDYLPITVFRNSLGGWVPPSTSGFASRYEDIWWETSVSGGPSPYGIWIYVISAVVVIGGVSAGGVYWYRKRARSHR